MAIITREFSYPAHAAIQLSCLEETYAEALYEFKLAQEFFDECSRLTRVTPNAKNTRSLTAALQGLQGAYNSKNDAREILESYRTELHAALGIG